MLKRLGAFLDFAVPLSATILTLLLLAIPNASTEQRMHFAWYLARQAVFDLALLLVMLTPAWLEIRFGILGVRKTALGSAGRPLDRRILAVMFVSVVMLGSLLFPLFYTLRARAVFWRDLSSRGYALQQVASMHALHRSGRIEDASQLATRVFSTLKGTSHEHLVRETLLDLELRKQRSTQLAGNVSQARAKSWNPIGDRAIYFQLAEALRVNPQNHVAADALGIMVHLLRDDLATDISATCGPRRNGGQLRTLSVLEWEVRQAAYPLEKQPAGAEACAQSIYDIWQVEAVGCFLAINHHTRAPFNRAAEKEWTPDLLDECGPENII